MRNLLIILLTVCIVILGCFLPDLLLRRNTLPEIKMDYQQVEISSESSSDYAWRMERLAEHYYGDEEHLLTTYISGAGGEEGSETQILFRNELNRLIAAGVVPVAAGEKLTDNPDCQISYYYVFDNEAISGFRIAEFTASGTSWRIALTLDVESGKLAKVEYAGADLIPGGQAVPTGGRSWYDVLRAYGDYLGLSQTALPAAELTPITGTRSYYDSVTSDRLAARLTTGSAWLELRALNMNYSAVITVYGGGK